MIPLRDENPSSTAPTVTRTLIALNVVAFVYELTLGPQLREFLFSWGMVPLRLTLSLGGEEPLSGPGLTLFSSMFLHGGWLHLIGNMWYLWIFGDNIEDRLGHFGYAVFYVLAGLVSALTHYALNTGSRYPTVGASGAIAGVLGAYAVAFPRARVITLVPIFFFLQIMQLPAIVLLGFWFVLQFFSGTLSLGAGGGGVAWWAHIGGFLFGVVVMILFGRRPRRRSLVWGDEV